MKQRSKRQCKEQVPGKKRASPLIPRTDNQKKLLHLLRNKDLVFAAGDAGTGKTYCATRFGCELLDKHEVSRIIVARPAVEAGEKLGYLPGDEGEKFAPYADPVLDILKEHFGGSHVSGMMRTDRIVMSPLAYMRGKTFKDAFVLLDEAQNITEMQMKMFLTRIGENCRVCVAGDHRQIDIKERSGLVKAIEVFRDEPEFGVVEFGPEDCVRSSLARKVLHLYK